MTSYYHIILSICFVIISSYYLSRQDSPGYVGIVSAVVEFCDQSRRHTEPRQWHIYADDVTLLSRDTAGDAARDTVPRWFPATHLRLVLLADRRIR